MKLNIYFINDEPVKSIDAYDITVDRMEDVYDINVYTEHKVNIHRLFVERSNVRFIELTV